MFNTRTSRWLCLLTSLLLVNICTAATFPNPGVLARLKGLSAQAEWYPTNVNMVLHSVSNLSGYANSDDITIWQDPFNAGVFAKPIGTAPKKETYKGYPVAVFPLADRRLTNNFLFDSSWDTAFTLVHMAIATNETAGVVDAASASYWLYGDVGSAHFATWASTTPGFTQPLYGWGEVYIYEYDGATMNIYAGLRRIVNTSVSSTMSLATALHIGATTGAAFPLGGYTVYHSLYKRVLPGYERTNLVNYLCRSFTNWVGNTTWIIRGDSLSAGTGGHPWITDLTTNLIARNVHYGTLKHVATAGDKLTNAVLNVQSEVLDLYASPSVGSNNTAIVWLLTNDIAAGYDTNFMKADFTNMCNAIKTNGIKVHWVTSIGRTNAVGWTLTMQTNLLAMNHYITNTVGTWATSVYDAYRDFPDDTDTTWFDADGVHLNDAGYRRFQNSNYIFMPK